MKDSAFATLKLKQAHDRGEAKNVTWEKYVNLHKEAGSSQKAIGCRLQSQQSNRPFKLVDEKKIFGKTYPKMEFIPEDGV